MKAKNIKAVCAKVIRQWTESIADQSVREVVQQNSIITGGAIASMLLGEEVKDFDVYFRTKEAALVVAYHYAKQFNNTHGRQVQVTSGEDRVQLRVQSTGVAESDDHSQDDESKDGQEIDAVVNATIESDKKPTEPTTKPKFRPVFISSNAISLSNKVQVVTRFFGEPDVIHENYDFVHCTNYWCSWNGELTLRPAAMEALLARDLRYVGSKYPLCSLIRTRKFVQRGWQISAGQYLKMAMNLQQFDLTNLKVLEDQLTGVDAAYFDQIIRALTARDSETVDRSYLAELIDRMF